MQTIHKATLEDRALIRDLTEDPQLGLLPPLNLLKQQEFSNHSRLLTTLVKWITKI